MNPNIQALRAMAAMLVVLHHAFPHYMAMGGSFAALIAVGKLGFSGVDIFFVISGFVVALTTTDKPRGRDSAINFFKNRIARIYLGYWPFLALTLIFAGIYGSGPLQDSRILKSILLLEPKGSDNVLSVAWSLTYELYFYILFISLFWCPAKKLASYMLIFFLLILSRNLFIHQKIFSLTGFLTSHFLLEFCAGALLYYYRSFFLKRHFIAVALTGIVVGAVVGVCNDFGSGQKRVYSFGVAAFCLVWLFLLLDHLKLYQANKIWVHIGDASYTIYLSHILILDAFVFSGLRDFMSGQSPLVTGLVFFIVILGIVFFSLQFYIWIEAPLYRRFRSGRATNLT